MATVGQQLTAPESGWRRYDDTDNLIKYGGSWTRRYLDSSGNYNKTLSYSNTNSYIEFIFYGTKFRVIDEPYTDRSTDISVYVDDVLIDTMNQRANYLAMRLVYEKTGLTNGRHKVRMVNNMSNGFTIDAIDINSDGYLLAQVGQVLTAPEPGWRRYDDRDSRILIYPQKLEGSASYFYNNTSSYTLDSSGYITFKFKGTRCRIIASSNLASVRPSSLAVYVDGIYDGSYNEIGTASGGSILRYEIMHLSDIIHTVRIQVESTTTVYNLVLDAIDIDSDGYLLHPTLTQRTKLEDMEIGDCIPCKYTATTSGVAGYFSEFGTCIADEIPVTGTATPNGLFYLHKLDDGLLGADRIVQTNISWDTLHAAKFIEGRRLTKGVDFAGNSYISIPYSASLAPTAQLSVRVLAEIDYSRTDNMMLISKNQVGGYGINLNGATIGSGNIGFMLYISGAYKYATIPLSTLSAGKHEFAGSFDGRYVKFYVDGQLRAATDLGATYAITYGHNNGLIIGADAYTDATVDPNPLYLTGKIYDVAVWNKSVDFSQVYPMYTGLVSYWDLSEIPGTTIKDNFGINHGTLTNGKRIVSNTLVRSFSGGNSYLGSDGLPKLTNQFLGAWPANNEWDTYVVNSNLGGKITPGDDNVWHWKSICSSTKDTMVIGAKNVTSTVTATADSRAIRGYEDQYGGINRINFNVSASPAVTVGFRPMFEYMANTKQTNLWY